MTEQERRELAYQHRGEVTGEGEPVVPKDFPLNLHRAVDVSADGQAVPAKLMPGTVARGPTGLLWHYSGPQSDDHLPILGHEWTLVNIAKALLPQDGVFLDVGAHVGLYSLELASKARVVLAWEANSETAARLEANAELNGLTEKIWIYDLAAWDKIEVLGMLDPHGKIAGGSSLCEPLEEGKEYVAVTEGSPLDDLLTSMPDWVHVDLIKIDVEGAERRVLAGARKLIREHRPTLFIEMHDIYLPPGNREAVEAELAEVGYEHGPNIPYGPDGGYHLICKPLEAS